MKVINCLAKILFVGALFSVIYFGMSGNTTLCVFSVMVEIFTFGLIGTTELALMQEDISVMVVRSLGKIHREEMKKLKDDGKLVIEWYKEELLKVKEENKQLKAQINGKD